MGQAKWLLALVVVVAAGVIGLRHDVNAQVKNPHSKTVAKQGSVRKPRLDTKVSVNGKRRLEKAKQAAQAARWRHSKADWLKHGGPKNSPLYSNAKQHMPIGVGFGKRLAGDKANRYRLTASQKKLQWTKRRLARGGAQAHAEKAARSLFVAQDTQIKQLNDELFKRRKQIAQHAQDGKRAELDRIRDTAFQQFAQAQAKRRLPPGKQKIKRQLTANRMKLYRQRLNRSDTFSPRPNITAEQQKKTRHLINTIVNGSSQVEKKK